MNVRSGECKPRTSRGQYTCDNSKKPVTIYLPDNGPPNEYGQLVFIKKIAKSDKPLVFISNKHGIDGSEMVVIGNDNNPLYVTAIFDGNNWTLDQVTVGKNETLNSALNRKRQLEDKRHAYISNESNKYKDKKEKTIGGIPKVAVNDGKLKVNKKPKVKSSTMGGGAKAYMLKFDENGNEKEYMVDLSDTVNENDGYKQVEVKQRKDKGDHHRAPRADFERENVKSRKSTTNKTPTAGNDLLNRRPKHPNLIYEGDKVILTNEDLSNVKPKMPPPQEKDFHVHDDDAEDENSFSSRRKATQQAYNDLYDGFYIKDSDEESY